MYIHVSRLKQAIFMLYLRPVLSDIVSCDNWQGQSKEIHMSYCGNDVENQTDARYLLAFGNICFLNVS